MQSLKQDLDEAMIMLEDLQQSGSGKNVGPDTDGKLNRCSTINTLRFSLPTVATFLGIGNICQQYLYSNSICSISYNNIA